jgi:hypothetical protein
VSRAYPPASFAPPQVAAGFGGATWFRVFRCPACQTVLGRQRIGLVYGLDEQQIGVQPTGHTIERVELSRGLVPRDPDDDGMLRFGLPRRAYLDAASPPGTRRRSSRRRETLVLPSVEGGDSYHVARHDPRRARTSAGDFVLALNRERALLPFVVTCLNLGCKGHWLVAGAPSAAELAAATPPATAL